MATYIYVNDQAPTLLGRNRADAANNRLRGQQRLWLRQQADQRAAEKAQAKPVDYAHRKRTQQADEPSASSFPLGQLGHFWWFTRSEPVINTGNYSGILGSEGLAQYNGDVVTGYSRTSRLYCGDGSQYVEFTHGQTPQVMIPASSSTASSVFYGCVNATYFFVPSPTGTTPVLSLPHEDKAAVVVLPVGKDVSVVLLVACQWSYSINSTLYDYDLSPNVEYYEYSKNLISFDKVQQNSLIRRCFIVSNTSIRELNTPPAFDSCFQELLPDATESSIQAYTAWSVGLSNIKAPITVPTYVINAFEVSESFQGMYGVVAYPATPGIFNVASQNSNIWNGVIGSAIKPFPGSKSWLVEDTSDGAYTPANGGTEVSWRQFFDSNLPRRYGKWNTPNQTPTPTAVTGGYEYNRALFTPQPSRTFFMRPARSELPEGFEAYFPTAGFRIVWDWDDPDYCKRMCLALGFTQADLVP